MDFDLRERTLLLVVGGSRAYGIHRATSDVDVKGVGVPPARYLHGFAHRFEQADGKDTIRDAFTDLLTDADERRAAEEQGLEGTVFELRKFMSLAAEANPNILDVLFCRDEEVRLSSLAGRRLREQRDAFLSTKVRHTFSGYAMAQLKRIVGHRQWLLDPPKGPPSRAEHGLPEQTLIPADQLAAATAAVRKQVDRWELDLSGVPAATVEHVKESVSRAVAEIGSALRLDEQDARWLAAARTIGLDDNLVEAMRREREYESAARRWRQYRDWKASRNAARAELEAKHGYDTKHGAHLVRLLRMGIEALRTGRVVVWRGAGGAGDAEELLAIRAGAWSYDELMAWAQEAERELQEVGGSGVSPLPRAPDREALDALCIELVETVLRDGVVR
ncbi:MAG: nucleotidyltransferase domain-containing protein [Alphaproteobacteria bacterium]|nr:nucleotidyltransferase domain-containing protein [Alphaproteobacteria bacterium]